MDAFRFRSLALESSLREVFARHGLRCTRQREVLYEVLAECRSHPTAEDLFHMAAARTAMPGCCDGSAEPMSLATVYNTLDALVAAGLARRIACPCGPARFDADMSEHAHVATADGRIADLPPDLSERLLRNVPQGLIAEIERRLGARVLGLSVQVVAGPADPV